MKFNIDKHKRRSIRLRSYDYSREGCYFITVCANNREELFGVIRRGTTCCALNKIGKAVEKLWQQIPLHFSHVDLDKYVIMPNHIHGILILNKRDQHDKGAQNGIRVQHVEPLQNEYQKIIPGSIGTIIRGFKAGVTRWARQNSDIYTVWQRNYHDRIIRYRRELKQTRKYIIKNPRNWADDENNPINIKRQRKT
jgi:REP element-mobilizing transposase RayT